MLAIKHAFAVPAFIGQRLVRSAYYAVDSHAGALAGNDIFADRYVIHSTMPDDNHLALLTLGFYRFWAKTRIRRYLWGHLAFEDEDLEYTGTGRELFLGFLCVVVVVLIPFFGGLERVRAVLLAFAPEWVLVPDVAQAAALLERAQRPLILAGGGVHISGAQAHLRTFAEAFGLPVAHTMSGKGAIACVHPLSAGLFGRYSRIANDLIAAADCLLVVGCKLGEIATRRYALIAPETPLIHLDCNAEEFGRTTHADVALWEIGRAHV